MAAIQEIGQYLVGKDKVPLDATGGNTRGEMQTQGSKHLGSAEDTKAAGSIIAAERQLLARIGIRGDKALGVNRAVPGTPRI